MLLPDDPLADIEQLPLVPTVSSRAAATPRDFGLPRPEVVSHDYGFAGSDSVDWSATPLTSEVRRGSGYTTDPFSAYDLFTIRVMPSDPISNPAPICVLSDLEVLGISVVPSAVSVFDEALSASKQVGKRSGRSLGTNSTSAQNAEKTPVEPRSQVIHGEPSRLSERCYSRPSSR